MKHILINIEPFEKRVAITKKDILEEFHVERSDQLRLAGNIYKGIIESVLPGIGAIFVDIGTGKNGFLYVDDVEEKNFQLLLEEEVVLEKRTTPNKGVFERLRKGQEIIVQVVKEPIGTKGPLLTTDISIPGKYIVVMPFNETIGISKRVEDRQKRSEIKATLEKLNLPKGVGCIARTQSIGVNPRQLKLECRYLLNLWARVQRRADQCKPPHVIYEEYDLPLRVIRDYFDEDVERILVDSREEYRKISRFANSIQPQLRKKIYFYRGKQPLYERYGIEERIEKIFRRKIFLKSGGSIIIEQAESLVAVDVNTGKFKGKTNLEETAFRTNMEAASEIARQIMLRDIGGIIVIDFIDMEQRDHRRQVRSALEEAFKNDKAKINILTVSPIGLIEMTRQRVRRSIESVSFRECPYCNGMGRVKTPATIAIEAIRKTPYKARERREKEIVIVAHPDVAEYIETTYKDAVNDLSRRLRKKILVRKDVKLHVEDVYFE